MEAKSSAQEACAAPAALAAPERVAAAEQRTADLAQLTQLLHQSTQALSGGLAIADILAMILRGVVQASGASGGAVLRRVGPTSEFTFELIHQDGALLSAQALQGHPFAIQVREVSRNDPAGYFARLAAGETLWHLAEDDKAGPIGAIQRWHAPRRQRALWDIPFEIGGRVAGYLGLAFEHADPPNDGVRQAVLALAAQVGLTLAMTDLAGAAERTAVAREQESAARILAGERERQAAELAAIADRVDRSLRLATDRLAQATNVRAVILDMLREGSTIVDAQGVIECGLLLYDPAARLLRFEAMFANGAEVSLEGTPLQGPFPVDSEVLALPWLRIQQERWLWGLTEDASVLATTAREYHESKGTRSVAYLSLRRGQDCIGFVGFSLRSAHPPTAQQVDLLQSVGSQVALAVEVQRLATAHEQALVARERQRIADLRSIELAKANVALQATIDAVTSMQSLDDFMPRVVSIVARAFEAVGAGYFEHPEGTIYHRFWLENGKLLGAADLPDLDPAHLPVLEMLARGFSIPPEHLGVDFRERLRPNIVHHRIATASPALHALCVSRGWDWELNIPLFANDRTDAAITFFHHEDQPFTEADVSLAESLAKQISLARQVGRTAERERQIAVARERAAELARANQVMSRVNDLMSSEINPESALNHVLRELAQLVGADSAALFRYEPGARQLRFTLGVERGRVTDELAGHPYGHADRPASIDDFPAWSTLVQDRRQHFSAMGADHTVPPSNAYHASRGHKMLALSALMVAGEPVGMLGLAFLDDTPLSDTRRELFGALAQQTTLALQLVSLAEQARAAAVSHEREAAALTRARELERASSALQATIDVLATVDGLAEFVPSVLRLVSAAFDSAACAYYEHLEGEPTFLRYWLWRGEVLGPEELRRQAGDQDRRFLQTMAQGFHLPVNFRDDQSGRTQVPVVINHEEQADDELDIDRFYRAHGLALELRVPLIVAGRADGALVIRRSAARPFNESELALAGNLGKQLALATQSHRLAERVRIDSLARVQEQAVVRERERMSRDIHDTLAQGYAAILVHAQALKLSPRPEWPAPVLSGIEMFERLAKENLAHARRTMQDLRADPFGRVALAVTLGQCAAEETTPELFAVELDAPSEELWVPRYVEVELRRIVKEALSNARRHARTGIAWVRLSVSERRCSIRVIDRGVGFDSRAVGHSFGIRGMRERAGRAGADLAIETSPGHGTIVSVTIDLESSGDGSPRQ